MVVVRTSYTTETVSCITQVRCDTGLMSKDIVQFLKAKPSRRQAPVCQCPGKESFSSGSVSPHSMISSLITVIFAMFTHVPNVPYSLSCWNHTLPELVLRTVHVCHAPPSISKCFTLEYHPWPLVVSYKWSNSHSS